MTPRKTGNLTIRIDPDLKEEARRVAAEERRSLASLIEALLDQHIKARKSASEPEAPKPKRGRK